MTDFRHKLNSRKLMMALLMFFTATALLVMQSIEAEHWVTVTITIGGAYMATQAYVDKQ